MRLCFALEDGARRREQRAVGEASVDRLVGRGERRVGAQQLGTLERDLGLDEQRRVEQDGALDAIGRTRGQLDDEPAAEAVPQPDGPPDAERVGRLDEVGDVLRDAPRRQEGRAAVPAQVDAHHAVPGQAPGEIGEPAAVARDSMQAHDRLPGRVAPLGDVQLHASTILPK